MTVSVAMTTYKGKEYIEGQLDSIFAQTMLPDEMVICDDASPDDTADYIEKILRKAPKSISIKLVRNPHNIGFTENFEKCIQLCTGDIICFSDQDDIWNPKKIESILLAFESDEQSVMFFSDAIVIDDKGKEINNSLNAGWDIREDKEDTIALTRINVRRHGVPYGNTIAFKRSLLANIVPFPKGYGHDEWISLCAPLFGKVITSEEKLVRYRRHSTNTSGNHPSIKERLKIWDKEAWFTHASSIKNVFQTYLDRFGDRIPKEIQKELHDQISFQTLLEDITTGRCWGGIGLLKTYMNGTYQKLRGNRNTFILDEVYLLTHIGRQ